MKVKISSFISTYFSLVIETVLIPKPKYGQDKSLGPQSRHFQGSIVDCPSSLISVKLDIFESAVWVLKVDTNETF